MNISWFPQHMRTSEEILRKSLKSVDLVFEVLDARIPASSRDPRIDSIIKQKPRIVVMNKSDLSHSESDRKWMRYFEKRNVVSLNISAFNGKGIGRLIRTAHDMVSKKESSLNRLKSGNKPAFVLVAGIPNVGKSTLINAIAGRKKAKMGNKPGVTRTKQRVTTKANLELMDTPGILWPKEDERTFVNLALIGTVKDEVLDLETLCFSLLGRLIQMVPENLERHYGITVTDFDANETMAHIARKRGCLRKGGVIDAMRVSRLILNDFRKGQLGEVTLELPGKD